MARLYDSRKRILVTGGAGFIGSHLTDRLLDQGNEVLCVDNLFTGTKRNIDHLHTHPRFEFIRHDVTFPLYVEVDEIYNLACPASPVHYQHDPVQTTKTSVHGAINMLGLAKRLRCRILQASTSEVYGDPAVHPQPESYWGNVNPVGPRSCYDEGKRCAETLFFDYHRQHNPHAQASMAVFALPDESAFGTVRELVDQYLQRELTIDDLEAEFRELTRNEGIKRKRDLMLLSAPFSVERALEYYEHTSLSVDLLAVPWFW